MPQTYDVDADHILAEYRDVDPTRLAQFWGTVTAVGTPLRSADGVHTTFLWRDTGAGVPMHVHINRVTDKANYDLGRMQQVPGTDIHVCTLELAPTHRASYGFQPALAPGEYPQGPPPHDSYPACRDPFNAQVLAGEGEYGLSVVSGPASPGQAEWEAAAVDSPGPVITEDIYLGGAERPLWFHLPGNPGPEPLPLLTLFDAEAWFPRLHLPAALDTAQAAGTLPPLAVLGIANVDRPDRVRCLSANADFLAEVAATGAAWAQVQAAARGVQLGDAGRRIIAGQSLGGLSALVAVLNQPGAYAHAIAHSPSLWWEPGVKRSPADLGARPVDWVTERFGGAPISGTTVHLGVGLREGRMLPGAHLLEQTMRHRGWDVELNVYDGGHDLAWWRGALLDDLTRILSR